jgi:hypothetical protein
MMDFTPVSGGRSIARRGEKAIVGYEELDPAPDFVVGYARSGSRSIPVVSSNLNGKDRLGAVKVRCGFGRDGYAVAPGLYAVGAPGPGSPVLVSANYKLSFDALRKELGGIDAWILVLDTKGVNVWCAAGKGSFGTAELLDKIARARLREVVSHNALILPQLGATGVSAPEIARLGRFKAAWGPVRAADIRAYLAAGMKKDERMRRVEFALADRMRIAPVELSHAWPFAAAGAALALLAALPPGPGFGARAAWTAAALLGSIVVGALAFPALLPFLPSRIFAVKGAALGAAWGLACAAGAVMGAGASWTFAAALVLASTPVVSFIAMNFTGSSTFTCQSGAADEVEKGLVPMIASAGAALVLGGAARIFGL